MLNLNTPNLVITVLQGSGTFTKDENGNPVEATTSIQIYISAKKKSNPQVYNLPGVSTDDIYLTGKVVAKSVWGDNWIPSILPSGVGLETTAIATIDGEKGNFRFVPVTQSRLDGIRAMGERVAGYLRVTARN